ncbi:hypothetical protein [Halomicrococcus sp. NG-SE-24]|uniref:hypothetical protein n=1 Tax=Halomicrococcus sp. NG-SE-24 TaxID=3436928 RepID=UPI003D962368
MTVISDRYERALVRLLQVGMLAIAGVGVYRGSVNITINASIALAVTVLPAVLERDYGVRMESGLVLWLTVAVSVHAFGALGPYRTVPWYDSLAHALSASIVAVAGYATFRTVERHSDRVTLPEWLRFAFVLVFVMAFGVLWEMLEFATGLFSKLVGGDAVLAQYGLDDIVYDLVFNQVGAVVVAAWDRVRPTSVGLLARTTEE